MPTCEQLSRRSSVTRYRDNLWEIGRHTATRVSRVLLAYAVEPEPSKLKPRTGEFLTTNRPCLVASERSSRPPRKVFAAQRVLASEPESARHQNLTWVVNAFLRP